MSNYFKQVAGGECTFPPQRNRCVHLNKCERVITKRPICEHCTYFIGGKEDLYTQDQEGKKICIRTGHLSQKPRIIDHNIDIELNLGQIRDNLLSEHDLSAHPLIEEIFAQIGDWVVQEIKKAQKVLVGICDDIMK